MTIALNDLQDRVIRTHSRLGMEVLPGCDINNLTDKEVKKIKQSLWKHGVIVIRKQNVKASQLREFARLTFGERIFGPPAIELDPALDPDLQSPGVDIIGNPKGLGEDSQTKITNKWHQDKDSLPNIKELDMNALYAVMLYGVKVPLEGKSGYPHTTEFIDLVEAYNNLELTVKKQIQRMYLQHSSPIKAKKNQQQEEWKKIWPIVSTHKVTGKKGLYLGGENSMLIGMEHREKEAKEFWLELLNIILDRTPIYSHVWQPGDLVIWDNSQIMHRSTFYNANKHQRIALRLGVVDESYT